MYAAGVNGAIIFIWIIVGLGVAAIVGLGSLVYHYVA